MNAVIGTCLLSIPAVAGASQLHIMSQSVSIDSTAQLVEFAIRFDQVPDFSVIDGAGRPMHEFQYYVDSDYNRNTGWPVVLFGADVIVRGGEIHVAGDIPIRNWGPIGGGGPNSGGWGPIRGRADFTLSGSTLEFSAPWPVLGFNGGPLRYHLGTFHYGASVSWIEYDSRVAQVPMPSSAGLAMLGLFALGSRRRR